MLRLKFVVALLLAALWASAVSAAVVDYQRIAHQDGRIEYRLYGPGIRYVVRSGNTQSLQFDLNPFLKNFAGNPRAKSYLSVNLYPGYSKEEEYFGKTISFFTGSYSSLLCGFVTVVCDLPGVIYAGIDSNVWYVQYGSVFINFDDSGRVVDFGGGSFAIDGTWEFAVFPEESRLWIYEIPGFPMGFVGAYSGYRDGALDLALVPVPAAGPLAAVGLALLWGVGLRRAGAFSEVKRRF